MVPLGGAREGGLVGAKSQKLSCRSSVLANEMRGGLYLGSVDLFEVGYTEFESVGGCH